MRKEKFGVAVTLCAVSVAIGFLLYGRQYFTGFLASEEIRTSLVIFLVGVGAVMFYKLSSRIIGTAILMAKGTEGDVKMIKSLWKFVVGFIALLLIISIFLQWGIVAAIFSAFGGLLIGWSLQTPVTGFIAWILIVLLRPFKVNDRVLLPSLGLIGDVLSVGPMYIVLNQIGGTIGSEEPANRTILIPNTMLFGNVVINYTPQLEKEKMREIVQPPTTQSQSYILDEVVWRITFDSDWNEAESILLNAAREVTADIIKESKQEPYIRSDVYDYGIYLRLRYMTLATDRPRITHEINKKIFEGFGKNEKVDFAIPYIYSFKKGRGWAPPSAQTHLETIAGRSHPNLEKDFLTKICSYCQTKNLFNATYCSKCGKKCV